MEHWNPLDFQEQIDLFADDDATGDPELTDLANQLSSIVDSDDMSSVTTTTTTTLDDWSPLFREDTDSDTTPTDPRMDSAQLIEMGLNIYGFRGFEDTVRNFLTVDSQFVVFFELVLKLSLHHAYMILRRLDELHFVPSTSQRTALQSLLAQLPSIEESSDRELVVRLVRDHYKLSSQEKKGPRKLKALEWIAEDPLRKQKKKEALVSEYYALRDDLTHLGIWIDAVADDWRRWPAKRHTFTPIILPARSYGPVDASITLSATIASDDDDLRQVWPRSGNVLRLTLSRATIATESHLKRAFLHLVSVAEQAVVRSLGHIQCAVIDAQDDERIDLVFHGGLRRNWTTTDSSSSKYFFIAPLTRLVAEEEGEEDGSIIEAARTLSELLLPENRLLLDRSQGVFHQAFIRTVVERKRTTAALQRHLTAIGNRDGARAVDLHVRHLPENDRQRLHVLDFLLNTSQVWARRVILDPLLAQQLTNDGIERAAFWTHSSFNQEWPQFERQQDLSLVWTPKIVEKQGRRLKDGFYDLWTITSPSLAPADGKPTFPRGRYGSNKTDS